MCMEMQWSNHELCRCCCCLCRDSATRRLECCLIECGTFRGRQQLQQKRRLSHESGSVVSTAGTATAIPQKTGKDPYPPTRVVQNQVMPCSLLSIHIHPSWSRIPNRLVPTLVHAHTLDPWQMHVELNNTTVGYVVHGMHLEGSLSKWSAHIRRSIVCFGCV